MTEDWPELTAFAEEMRSENSESWQRTERVRVQMSGLQPHLEVIARQYEELEVDGHLRLLNQQLLGGLGSVELIHSGMGIERVAALVWPAQFDSRYAGEESQTAGVLRIEVWLGPGLQDGRARIRIAGAKRLEAVLPTNADRFRSALLAVFRDPQLVLPPASEGEAKVDDAEAKADEAVEVDEDEGGGGEEKVGPS